MAHDKGPTLTPQYDSAVMYGGFRGPSIGHPSWRETLVSRIVEPSRRAVIYINLTDITARMISVEAYGFHTIVQSKPRLLNVYAGP